MVLWLQVASTGERAAMHMQVMVITSVRTERSHLEHLLQPLPADEDSIELLFASGLTELQRRPASAPDLILLNPQLHGSAQREVWHALSVFYASVPVILLAMDSAPSEARHRNSLNAAVYMVTGTTTRALLQQILHAVVVSTRHLQARTDQPSHGDVVLDAIADAVISTDARGRLRYANPAACRLLGAEAGEMAGRPVNELMGLRDPQTLDAIEHPVLQVLTSGSVVRLSAGCMMARVHGPDIMIEDATSPIRDASGAISGVVMVFHDVTTARELQEQVDYLARHDFLTGLPNRFAAQRHLEQILQEAKNRDVALAVMYIDLDKFKAVNDRLGHAGGDALLVSVGARLRGCFRLVDLVSRQGGDEFVVLMAPGTGRADATQAAGRIAEAIAIPHQVESELVQIGCSIGIALYPEHGRGGEELLRHADIALHSAKAAGRNGWRFFRPDLLNSVIARRKMEEAMRLAISRDQLELYYQPKVCLDDGALRGCAAARPCCAGAIRNGAGCSRPVSSAAPKSPA